MKVKTNATNAAKANKLFNYYVVYDFKKGDENGCGSMNVSSESKINFDFIGELRNKIVEENGLDALNISNIIVMDA